MNRGILSISGKISQKLDYRAFDEMRKTMQFVKDEEQIQKENEEKFRTKKSEQVDFYVARFTGKKPEDEKMAIMKEILEETGLVEPSFIELAFFDFKPSTKRIVKNLLTNGYKTGTLGHNKEGRFEQKLYPVKTVKPGKETYISYYYLFEFTNGNFNILLRNPRPNPITEEVVRDRNIKKKVIWKREEIFAPYLGV